MVGSIALVGASLLSVISFSMPPFGVLLVGVVLLYLGTAVVCVTVALIGWILICPMVWSTRRLRQRAVHR